VPNLADTLLRENKTSREVAETWKVPSEAAKWLLKLRERRG